MGEKRRKGGYSSQIVMVSNNLFFYEHFMEVYYVDVGFIWLEKKMEWFTLSNMDLAAMVDQPVTQINKKEFQTATCGKN